MRDPASASAAAGTSNTVGIQRHADARAGDGDVHFGARNEPEIRVGGARLRTRQMEADEQLAALEHGPPGRRAEMLDRDRALALRSGDHALRLIDHQRARGIGRRRCITQVAADGGAPLNLCRADQIDRFDQARPQALQFRVLADFGGRHGGAEPQSGRVDRDPRQIGDPLDVHERRGAAQSRAELHQEIRATGKNPCSGVRVDQTDRVGDGSRSFVAHFHFRFQILYHGHGAQDGQDRRDGQEAGWAGGG